MNEPLSARRDASESAEDTSTRHRILVATAEVLGRSEGAIKQLQLRGVRNLAKLLPEGLRDA